MITNTTHASQVRPSGRPLIYTRTSMGRESADVITAADIHQDSHVGSHRGCEVAPLTSSKTSPPPATPAVTPLRG